MEYEAYTPMALKQMRKMCSEMRARWPVRKVVMLHRLGLCPVGEASVIIAVSAEHRAEAIKAAEWGIDNLKATVPIWKKERYQDGAASWKENAEQPK